MSRATPRPFTRLPLRVKNVAGIGDTDGQHDVVSGKPKRDGFGTPPRKRAVPSDEVHVRNMPGYTSGKRSRPTLERVEAAPSCATPSTTVRIDHATRMSWEERYQREQQKAQAQRQWKSAFVRAFPKLVFYLDHVDVALKPAFTAQIAQLGGRVDAFFSRSVTHVVTTRPIPLAKAKENKEAARTPAARGGIAPPRIVTDTPYAGIPVHSDKNPLDDQVAPLPANDLLCKAQHFGMKIWRQDKLQNILSLLLAADPAAEGGAPQNLSEMLHQEKMQGTTERDPLALRNDYHYFGKHSYYVLVTDATNEHRPIVIHEYDRTAHEAQHKPPPWPVLYGDVEGRGLFVHVKPKDRLRYGNETGPRPGHLSLRRTASLNHAGARKPGPDSSHAPGTPVLMASDNSIALASTVASTTSTTVHSQGTALVHAQPDQRLAALTRRMHTPVDLKRTTDTQGSVVRKMLGMGTAESSLALRRTKSTNSLPRDPSSLKPREKRPGHCENCRCRFEDFDEHTRSRRHRKFAMDESNFVALDELLQRVQREPSEQGVYDDYTHQSTYGSDDDTDLPTDADAATEWADSDAVAAWTASVVSEPTPDELVPVAQEPETAAAGRSSAHPATFPGTAPPDEWQGPEPTPSYGAYLALEDL